MTRWERKGIWLTGAGLILVCLLAVLVGHDRTTVGPVTTQGRIERFGFSSSSHNLAPRPIAIIRVADGTTRAIVFRRQ